MNRRRAVLCILSVVGTLTALKATCGVLFAAKTRSISRHLREKLVNGLRPRHPNDFKFIDRVVKMVEDKKLSVKLVNVVFNWARHKPRRYKFPHFEHALKIEAGKRKIKVK